jgi:hypothetical protein
MKIKKLLQKLWCKNKPKQSNSAPLPTIGIGKGVLFGDIRHESLKID